MQALVDRHRQFVDNTLTNGKPVKFTQDGRDVIKLPGLRRHAKSVTDRQQRVLNAAACQIGGTHKYDHRLSQSQLLHSDLHWLDVADRVQ